MSLRRTVAAPFRQRGVDRLGESEFVVALSVDRDWFSADQAKKVVDAAAGTGLLSRDDGDLIAEFDPTSVEIPEGFTPDEDVIQRRSPFQSILDDLVAAGHEKRDAVAEINELQAGLDVTVEAAAALYARRHGIDVDDAAERALANLDGET